MASLVVVAIRSRLSESSLPPARSFLVRVGCPYPERDPERASCVLVAQGFIARK